MSIQLELLNPHDHGGLHLSDRAQRVPHFVQVVASEFASAAVTCPILLTKDAATDQFYAGAMFGFEPGENLLWEDEAFRPLDMERQGFFVTGETIAIDPRHSRFVSDGGELLFDTTGQPGERMRRIQRVLSQLKAGVEETDGFIRTLVEHGLVEPVDITVKFDDGKTLSLGGLYTVSLDAVGELDDQAVLDLFRSGYLQLIHGMAGSLRQIPALARRRNQRLAA